MTSVAAAATADQTDLRHLLRASVQLGLLQSALVGGYAIASKFLAGPLELAVLALILVVGVAATIALPGIWTNARSIEGIAGAAGIGLGAAAVFLVVDVAVFQPLGIYSNRWLEIGGGSNWWYHPVWWMVGTFLPWMGAWVLANQTAKSGHSNPGGLVIGTLIGAAAIMAVAKVAGFPGASFGLGTFGVSVLPAVAVMAVVTAAGVRRS
ncbi:MAG: hypothetical protein FJ206_13450 [Gemmatimonadetes bacterium]|nr:hypothetical protein [Gemmatimonadota bacterium]